MIHSPRAAASPVASLADARRGGLLAGSPGTADAAGGGGGAFQMGGVLSLEPMDSTVGQERYESQWQLVEELQCSLVAVASDSSSASSGSGSGSSAGRSLQPLRGEVELPPGRSVLTFLAAPVKRGLYAALSLRARLHHLPLHVAVHAPQPLWAQADAGAAGGGKPGSYLAAAQAGSRRGSRAGGGGAAVPLGGVAEEPGSATSAEAIVMLVGQALPRVHLSLLAAGGSLIAGQEQWLGLGLAPQRDPLAGARLELTWPLGLPGPSECARCTACAVWRLVALARCTPQPFSN